MSTLIFLDDFFANSTDPIYFAMILSETMLGRGETVISNMDIKTFADGMGRDTNSLYDKFRYSKLKTDKAVLKENFGKDTVVIISSRYINEDKFNLGNIIESAKFDCVMDCGIGIDQAHHKSIDDFKIRIACHGQGTGIGFVRRCGRATGLCAMMLGAREAVLEDFD